MCSCCFQHSVLEDLWLGREGNEIEFMFGGVATENTELTNCARERDAVFCNVILMVLLFVACNVIVLCNDVCLWKYIFVICRLVKSCRVRRLQRTNTRGNLGLRNRTKFYAPPEEPNKL